ncbi:MAG TPA: ABC transporter permease [bacterium]|nr:ABC transporter permease [bacterium]
MNRVMALALRIFRQFLRDRRTLVLIFAVPIVIMGLLTWILQAKAAPFRLTVLAGDGDSAMVAGMVRSLLLANANVEMVDGLTVSGVTAALKDGRIQGAVVMRGGGLADLQAGKRAELEVMVEGSDPMLSQDFLRELQIIQRPLLDAIRGMIYLSDDEMQMVLPPELKLQFLYGGENFTATDYLAPSLIAFMAFFFVFMLTAVSFLRERAQGTMERLLASPLTPFELIAGYLFGFIGFALAQTLVIMFFMLVILKIHYAGSLASIFLVELILIVGASNMGIFFSSFAKNEFQVAQFIPLVIVPQVFLSGLLWSIETMPRTLQYLAYALPLTYANLALRDLMIKGLPLARTAPELAALILFAALMVAASVLTIRKSV